MTTDHSQPKCIDPEVGAKLVSYALGTLTDADAEAFEQHVLHCPACQSELEEATPALDTLKSTREQFVARAKSEDETFRAQFNRLQLGKENLARAESKPKRKNWIGTLWTAIWGHRWIVGTAGVTALAFMFFLRSDKDLLLSPGTNDRILSSESPRIAQVPKDLSQLTKLKSDVAPEQKVDTQTGQALTPSQAEVAPVPSPSKMNEVVLHEEALSAKAPLTKLKSQEQVKKTVVVPPAEEFLPLTAVQKEEAFQADVSSKGEPITLSEKSAHKDIEVSQPIDLNQTADLAFGTFHPELFSQESYTQNHVRGGRESSEKAFHGAAGFKVDKRAPSVDDEAIADSLFAQSRYRKARDLFAQQWQADSTNARCAVMTGVSSFAMGDLTGAREALQIADKLLPPGTQKVDVALLLARIEILEGKVTEAKARLQNCLQINGDPERIQHIQRAIAQIDSIQNAHAPKPIPK